jgi:hypothetical protein
MFSCLLESMHQVLLPMVAVHYLRHRQLVFFH